MSESYNILIVDDEPMNQIILEEILSEVDEYNLTCVDSGEECLSCVADEIPDLILLDVNMPGMSGIEVCKDLRGNDAFANIVIFFVSALASDTEKEIGMNAGANDYVTKPFVESELLALIAAVFK